VRKRTKIILAASLLTIFLLGSAYTATRMSVLGADELNLYCASLTIDGDTLDGGGQQVISWDKDGPLTVYRQRTLWGYTYIVRGYNYPEFQFTVGDLKYVGVFDNLTVETKINDTATRFDNYVIYKYTFKVWLKGDADAYVLKGVISAYEGKFATESPYQPAAPLNFLVKVGLKIEPFSTTDVNEYGITWMQISDINIDEQIPSGYEPSSDVVFYQADRDLTNVGATWGYNYKANELIGKDLPTEAELTLIGSYRAGSVCLYDPGNIIPGDLYQVVPIEPIIEATVTVHIAGHNFYVEDEEVVAPVESAPPPPPIPKPVMPDYILILIIAAAMIPIVIFGTPRIIRALRRKM